LAFEHFSDSTPIGDAMRGFRKQPSIEIVSGASAWNGPLMQGTKKEKEKTK
jgi:hypothetical protein